jgi:hypothetical protein
MTLRKKEKRGMKRECKKGKTEGLRVQRSIGCKTEERYINKENKGKNDNIRKGRNRMGTHTNVNERSKDKIKD